MNRHLVKWTGALLLFLGTLPASAGVIYRWQDVTENPNTGPFSGYIEFSYELWAPGAHLFTSVSNVPDEGSAFSPLVGIESFFWSNPSGVGIEPHIELATQPCSFYHRPDNCGWDGGNSTALPRTGGAGIGATFDITFGPILEGFLSVNDTTTDVRMGSAGPLWTIERVGSDGDGICHSNDGRCWGSTGLWLLDLSTLPARVPEPSTTWLMLLGLTAMLVAHLRNRSVRNLVARVSVSVALLISAMPASAGVIYRWQDVTLNPNIGPITGHIEFSYDYWSNGGSLDDDGSTGPPDTSYDPLLGVDSFYWDNPSQAGFRRGLDLSLQSCADYAYCDDFNFPHDFEIFADWDGLFLSRSRVEVVFGALLTGGRLSFGNHEMGMGMHATGPLWTIDGIGTDWDGACRDFDLCSGGTGLWVLDLSTLPPSRVPEPLTAGLALFGLATLFASIKRRRPQRGV